MAAGGGSLFLSKRNDKWNEAGKKNEVNRDEEGKEDIRKVEAAHPQLRFEEEDSEEIRQDGMRC